MFDLTKTDMVLFDFDDTLCIHSERGAWSAQDYEQFVVNTIRNKTNYPHSACNAQMRKFLQYCSQMNIATGLISHVGSAREAESKTIWIYQVYGVSIADYSVSSREKKVPMLQAIAKANGLSCKRIMLVDDMCITLDEAADAGFQTATPMEIVNFVNDLGN